MIRVEIRSFDKKLIVLNNKYKLKAVNKMIVFLNNGGAEEKRK